VSPPPGLKKEVLDIVGQLQAPTPGAYRNILANDVIAMVLSSQWLKKDEVNTK
jgi:hypothetical protein